MANKKKLGEMLVEAGLIDDLQLQSALAHQEKWGMRLGEALIELKFISERDIASFLEKQLNVRCVSIMIKELSPETVHAVTPEIAKKYKVFPLASRDKELVIATSNPLDLGLLDELSFNVGKKIVPRLALESEIKKAIRFYYDNIRDEEILAAMKKEEPGDKTAPPSNDKGAAAEKESTEKKEITTKTVLDALLTVLEKKGIVKRSEIFDEIKKKS